MKHKPEKERAEVPEVSPLTLGGVRYEPVLWGKARGLGQNGGLLAATDVATGQELWVLKIYDIAYTGDKEDDKQDVFISSLQAEDDGHLRVESERGGAWRVDLAQRTSTPLEE